MTGQATESIRNALSSFSDAVAERLSASVAGEPEEQLRGPFEALLKATGKSLGREVITKGESLLSEGMGKPDYAVLAEGALAGHVELKATGKGTRPSLFTGHDRDQWKRFRSLPNLLYGDGNSFTLFRSGSRHGASVELGGDLRDGTIEIDDETADAFGKLVLIYLAWDPIVPTSISDLAATIAPLCRLLRDEVSEELGPGSPLSRLAADWRELLFPDADDAQFADAYAQTVTYALLLARVEGASLIGSEAAAAQLQGEFGLLARTLQVLTDQAARDRLSASLPLLERVIGAVDPGVFKHAKRDPWLYFYEDFLAAYDPKLRRDAGVYYTPVEVVGAQVRIADALIRERLGKPRGLGDDDVLTLDPAVGTGTYLLGAIDHSLSRVAEQEGEGSVPGRATVLARNLHGFELMVGPYAVAQLRVARDLLERGATLPDDGPGIYLTDTLEHPSAEPKAPPMFYEPIAADHRRAQRIKDKAPILVCIGNPPYDRHDASASIGGWVRFAAQDEEAPLEDFLAPARQAGHGVHLKNLYNLYVYFWRWALWKVFEHKTAAGPGIVNFITASSYIAGPGFSGMRELMRRECDEVWILDLGGEGRGARRDDNVFAIQTPVAIAIAARFGAPDRDTPATVRYARVEGSRAEKIGKLEAIETVDDIEWQECPAGWSEPFRPAGVGPYFEWPELTEIFPWQHSGVQAKRLWPIAPTKQTLERRWSELLSTSDRREAFKPTRDRTADGSYVPRDGIGSGPRLAGVERDADAPPVVPYAYRSFDRQRILADMRVLDYPRPALWQTQGDQQVYLTSLFKFPLGVGPALTASASVPDLHHFRGSFGAKATVPLWRDADATEPNVAPGLLEVLSEQLGTDVSAPDLCAYAYAVLACPAYTARFEVELNTPGPRVPIPKDAALFSRGVELGRRLLWLHTYGERFHGPDRPRGQVPAGTAKWTHAVPEAPDRYPAEYLYDSVERELRVGEGVIAPVAPEAWNYEVSGLQVVRSWLGYRMRERAGRTSSPLDLIQPERWDSELNDGLRELLWVLEHSLDLHVAQAELLEEVARGPTFSAAELPTPTQQSRLAPVIGEPEQLELG